MAKPPAERVRKVIHPDILSFSIIGRIHHEGHIVKKVPVRINVDVKLLLLDRPDPPLAPREKQKLAD